MQDIRTEAETEGQNEDITQPEPKETFVESENRVRKSSRATWIALAVIAAALVITIAVIEAAYRNTSAKAPELPPPRTATSAEAPSPTELSNSFRAIAKAVKPAVVNINVVEISQERAPDFFGFELPNTPRRRPGTGSGIIVTPDGYILTNNHVVGNADQIEVTLSDNRKFKAKVIGADPESDLAVIKIDASGLPMAVLGDSDTVEQGDWVLALGSPFGLQQTLTAGIVSATGRELPGPQYSKYIQTDASINPGNSGGPLVDMRGEVIGINTLIFSQSGGNVGIGFSIASNTVRKIFNEIVKNGKVIRGYLGVVVEPLDGARARALGVEPNAGALVARVSPGTPAEQAGLKSLDVITAFDGNSVKSPRELTEAVAATPVDKTVRVDFIRSGQSQSVSVKITERPSDLSARGPEPEQGPNNEEGAQSPRLGISGQTVTPEMAAQMKLSASSGVLVRAVQPGSPASDAGIRHGDVIHRVDRTDVKTVEELIQAVNSFKSGEEFALMIERNGQISLVSVTLD